MKGKLLIVFVILLLGFILFSFLGGNKFYNVVKEGFSSNTYDSDTFTATDGSTAVISSDTNGLSVATVTPPNGSAIIYNQIPPDQGQHLTSQNYISYTGPNGSTAMLTDYSKTGGAISFQTNDANGNQITFTQNNSSTSSTSTSDTSNQNSNSNNGNSNYDNYNHYSGNSYPSIFYGPNGGTARIVQTPTSNTIVITNKNGTTDIYYINSSGNGSASVQSYYGPNGGSAKIITLQSGNQAIEITLSNGSKILYYSNSADAQSASQDSTINQYSPDTNTTGSDYNNAFANINPYASSYNNPYINTNTINGPQGSTYSTYDSSAYSNSLPQGIPKSMIPFGQEDLYILKSQVVPPVCPACPEPIVQCPDNNDVTKCPPCAPCSRCPEPAFDCKKVPNYNSFNPDYMPVPVLNSFSSFGM